MKKLTKGYIKNNKTGKIKKFLVNPDTFDIKRGAKYTEITSPMTSYPILQYCGGESETMKIKLVLIQNKDKIEDWLNFIEEFMPEPKVFTFTPPPTLLYVFGKIVKECVLLDRNIGYKFFDNELNAYCVEVDLDLKVVY